MPRSSRILLIHIALVLFAIALVARAAEVQLWQSDQWTARAKRQHFATAELPAPRGNIYDVRGVPLAMSREMVRLSIAPREVTDVKALARALDRLNVPRTWINRATDAHRAWVTLPGTYLPGDAAPVAAMRGVYTESMIERVYTQREAIRRVVGWVNASGRPMGGLELTLDSLLRGRPGHTTQARDSRGRRFESPADRDVEPQPGDAVVLTINQGLQEISERALADAIASTGADGGDIVILDPQDGEIRAMASQRQGRSFGSPAVSEPFEPGSTLKPLFASSLLMHHLARPTDTVNTENGIYTVEGRTIRDLHRASQLSLADVLRWSSNIGIVKFVSRMSPRQEYETLRDFGFGMQTGVPFPAEASGTLRAPGQWSRQSPASLAMGYEIAVTPLQLATAYAAIANGGELLQPAIVKEVRSPDGTVEYQHTRRVVRRVMSPEVAATVRNMMVAVVQEGTAKGAALGNFTVAGKSGTARRTGQGGAYETGAYTASFVGLFPAQSPQYVLLVKLDRPRSGIYGGEVSAPVSKIVLEAAIAARDATLDRRVLASSESLSKVVDSSGARLTAAQRTADHAAVAAIPADSEPAPYVLTLPTRARATSSPSAAAMHAVPEVQGLPLRDAVRTLHRAGFRVQLAGFGNDAASTVPQAGAQVRAGTVVRLVSTP
jgi:cell division protein FtsI (penicillin-binding protein 3)